MLSPVTLTPETKHGNMLTEIYGRCNGRYAKMRPQNCARNEDEGI